MGEFNYDKLLRRAKEKIPEGASSEGRFNLPEISVIHEGRTTIIRNFAEIAQVMHRDIDHIFRFLLKELGTSGEMDETRAIFQGTIPEKQIGDRIGSYLTTYVICGVCDRPDTELIRDGRVVQLRCHACGAVLPVKLKRKYS